MYCTCQLLIPCCHSHRPCARVGQLQPSLVLIRPISDFRITMVLLVLSVNSSNLHVRTFACGMGHNQEQDCTLYADSLVCHTSTRKNAKEKQVDKEDISDWDSRSHFSHSVRYNAHFKVLVYSLFRVI